MTGFRVLAKAVAEVRRRRCGGGTHIRFYCVLCIVYPAVWWCVKEEVRRLTHIRFYCVLCIVYPGVWWCVKAEVEVDTHQVDCVLCIVYPGVWWCVKEEVQVEHQVDPAF